MNLLTLTPADLLPGDVVRVHGLRCLVTDAPTLSASGAHWTDTLVTNRDEVPADSVPHAYTYRTTGWPSYAPIGEHRWTVQGNDLARFTVERA